MDRDSSEGNHRMLYYSRISMRQENRSSTTLRNNIGSALFLRILIEIPSIYSYYKILILHYPDDRSLMCNNTVC